MDTEINTDEMFGGDDNSITVQILSELSEFIALEMDAVSKLEAERIKRSDIVKRAKEKLHLLLKESGLKSAPFESGLYPLPTTSEKYKRASGVTDEELFSWLRKENLQNIIKLTVHSGTLQSTIRDHVGLGHEIPENIIRHWSELSVTMRGRTNFINSLKQGN